MPTPPKADSEFEPHGEFEPGSEFEPDSELELDAKPEQGSQPEAEDPTGERAAPIGLRGRLHRGWHHLLRASRRNGYLVVAAGAALLLARVIDFSPPDEVRVGQANVAQLVGDAPPQEFSHQLSNPQAVQLRATLRLYPDNELLVSLPDPETDAQSKLLSQPVITTLYGMNAAVDQTVRVEGGELEVEVSIDATPRIEGSPKAGKPPPDIVLESQIKVRSRRDSWWRRQPLRRVHLDDRAFLTKVEEHGYRVVFTVDEHLFSLDLEIHRGTAMPATMARSR